MIRQTLKRLAKAVDLIRQAHAHRGPAAEARLAYLTAQMRASVPAGPEGSPERQEQLAQVEQARAAFAEASR